MHLQEPPKLPEGYRLDLAEDPDAPALRRPDGTVVARFGAKGMMHEAVGREALENLPHTNPKPVGHDPSNTFVESPSKQTSEDLPYTRRATSRTSERGRPRGENARFVEVSKAREGG